MGEGLKVKPGHRLLIKSAILMPTAKKDEVTVIQIESEGYNKQKVVVPFCAMKGGSDHQKYVDLLVPSAAKLKIIHGEGPIHLVGSHCVDYFGFKDEDDETTVRMRKKATPRTKEWRPKKLPRRATRRLPPQRTGRRRHQPRKVQGRKQVPPRKHLRRLRKRKLPPRKIPRSGRPARMPRVPRVRRRKPRAKQLVR